MSDEWKLLSKHEPEGSMIFVARPKAMQQWGVCTAHRTANGNYIPESRTIEEYTHYMEFPTPPSTIKHCLCAECTEKRLREGKIRIRL